MGLREHDALVSYYCMPENIIFIDDTILEIYNEVTLKDLFNIKSMLCPDLIYIVDDIYLYVGEIKSTYSKRNIYKAKTQVSKYSTKLRTNGIPNIPFIIVDDYIRVIKND